jgi:hypothetical protein
LLAHVDDITLLCGNILATKENKKYLLHASMKVSLEVNREKTMSQHETIV